MNTRCYRIIDSSRALDRRAMIVLGDRNSATQNDLRRLHMSAHVQTLRTIAENLILSRGAPKMIF